LRCARTTWTTCCPRSATLVALRDSVLARLDKTAFDHLLVTRSAVSVALDYEQTLRVLDAEDAHSDS